MDLLQLHSQISNPSYYVIDIGASFGVPTDPVYQFITNTKYKGLCIEGGKNQVNELKKRTKFEIYDDYIYPDTIVHVFQKYNVHIDIDILKIDIDGFDLEILRRILSVYKPKIIIAEINEKIPPPIMFEVLYKDNYSWDFSHCYGFSIKSGEAVMTHFGYKIVEVYDLCNIICVNKELFDTSGLSDMTVEELYKKQYIDRIERLEILPWNENVNHWLEIEDQYKLKYEIIDYYSNNNERSVFDVKTKELNIDFVVE
jgi:hypothetical protein